MDITSDRLSSLQTNRALPGVVLLFLSLLLSACGGGGPDEEGESSATSTQTFKDSHSTSNYTSKLLSDVTDNNQQMLCQQQNNLLCEDFEWSSSLAYKASLVDWSLKGWQFSGIDSSGNSCTNAGMGGSQCALKWVQSNDKSVNNMQKASYTYSEYGAGYNNVVLSWAAKWSAQWVWDAESHSHLALESVSVNKIAQPLFQVMINANGLIQLIISGDEHCSRKALILESDKSFVLQGNNLGKWQQFKIEFNLDTEGTNSEVSLSVNNQVLISRTNIALGCSAEYSAPNSVSFLASRYNQQITTDQNVLVDNILIRYN